MGITVCRVLQFFGWKVSGFLDNSIAVSCVMIGVSSP